MTRTVKVRAADPWLLQSQLLRAQSASSPGFGPAINRRTGEREKAITLPFSRSPANGHQEPTDGACGTVPGFCRRTLQGPCRGPGTYHPRGRRMRQDDARSRGVALRGYVAAPSRGALPLADMGPRRWRWYPRARWGGRAALDTRTNARRNPRTTFTRCARANRPARRAAVIPHSRPEFARDDI